ncbi:MAG: hypothetical protein HY361_01860 [Candidatus Aenigmarchaeota archaeon]|nr:hypothetical protein [Candidatus Aenigmarchaeota archaeon]
MKASKAIEKKALQIFKDGRVKLDLETDKRMHFKVKGDSEEHSVIFDKEKNNFLCDCKFGSLKELYCSHIESSVLLMTRKK